MGGGAGLGAFTIGSLDVGFALRFGHVDGAQLIDVQGSSFDADIAKLDRATTYVVYCRSGNRSATAATRMRDAGLTVFDGGAMDAMVAAGWPTA